MCGRSWVQTPGRVIPITLKWYILHPCQALGIERIEYGAVRIMLKAAINGGAVYRESHPRAPERTHIPERIGLCGPLPTKSVWHSCVSASTAMSKYSPGGPEIDKSCAIKKRMPEAHRVYGIVSSSICTVLGRLV